MNTDAGSGVSEQRHLSGDAGDNGHLPLLPPLSVYRSGSVSGLGALGHLWPAVRLLSAATGRRRNRDKGPVCVCVCSVSRYRWVPSASKLHRCKVQDVAGSARENSQWEERTLTHQRRFNDVWERSTSVCHSDTCRLEGDMQLHVLAFFTVKIYIKKKKLKPYITWNTEQIPNVQQQNK